MDGEELHTNMPSNYSYPHSMVSPTQGLYSFSQTGPSAELLNASSWGAIAEGSQNFQDFPDNRSSHSGDVEEYIITSGQTTPRGSRMDHFRTNESSWAAVGLRPVPAGGNAMSRVGSSRSTGSSLSQSSQLSNMDVRGNVPAFRVGSQATGTMVGVDSCLLLDDSSTLAQEYWPAYDNTLGTGLDADSASFSASGVSPLHVVPSQMQFGPDANLPDNVSPNSWDGFPLSISRESSPAAVDETWFQVKRPLSPPNSSPELPCQSPSIDYNGQMKHDDINGSGISPLPDTMTLPLAMGNRREGESARNHDLYKNAIPGEDGLFHCPWEGDPSCNHRPEKLKCNYDKFVDSHLKPYRCKAEACDGARFSSTACLLRHEREAHGLHGHGDKPFLCHYDGCERGLRGNGFPRQWNLKDHMKRVHNDHGNPGRSPRSNGSGQQSNKPRKRKTDGSEASSRKSSQKNMPSKETKQPACKPLLEQWMDHRKAIEEMIRDLDKPEDARNIQQITEMQKRLSVMTQMTSELSSMPRADVLSVPSHMGFMPTG